MTWTIEDEQNAKREYLSMIGALCETEEFEGEWKGEWDSFTKETFDGRKVKVKGDREKYMQYWLQNQSIINDSDWNKLDDKKEDEYF